MKKFIKITTTLILTVVISAFSFPTLAVQSDNSVNSAYIYNSENSIELYKLLVNTIDKKDYGGMYLNENGYLNILSVNLTNTKSFVNKYKKQGQDVIYKDAQYSYAELEKLDEILLANMKALGISTLEIDEKNNCVRVSVIGLNKDKENTIRSKARSNGVVIENAINPPSEQTTVLNGSSISTVSGSTRTIFSLCCGVTWYDNTLGRTCYGFLTCAHGNSVGTTVYIGTGSSYLGVVRKRQYSGSVDASLVERDSIFVKSSYQFTDGTSYTGPAESSLSGGFPVGTNVTFYGQTTGKLTGKILSTTFSYTDPSNGTVFTDLVKTNCVTLAGDSGGAYKVEHGTGLVYTYVAGIHKGGDSISYSFYTDMTKASNALGFSGYVG